MEAVSAWVNEIVLHEVDLPRATPVSPAMEAEVSTAYCGGCSTSRSHLGYHASQRCSSNRQRRGDLASMDRREAMGRRHEDRKNRPLMA